MKLSAWAWAWALTGCMFLGNANAQGLRQPFSVQPAGFDYNRYLSEDGASPSDQPAPVATSAPASSEAAQSYTTPAPSAPAAATSAPYATQTAPVSQDGCSNCATPAPVHSAPSCGVFKL